MTAKKAPTRKKTSKKTTAKPAGPGRKKAGTRAAGSERCIALVSPEEFFFVDARKKVERALFPDPESSPSIFEAHMAPKGGEEATDVTAILDDLRTPSLFGGRKLVVLRGAESLDGDRREALLNTLEHIPSNVTVLLLMEKLRKASKLEKLLTKIGRIERFKAMYDRPGPWQRGAAEHDSELVRWVVDRAGERQLRLSAPDAFVLVQRVGNHPARLDSELEKLSIAYEPGATVSRAAIDALAPDAQEFKAFDLSDAIVSRDRERALSMLDTMLRDGMVGSDSSRLVFPGAIAGMVIGALRSRFATLLRARTSLEAGVAAKDVWTELKVAPFLRDTYAQQVRLRETQELRDALRSLLRFDLEMKGGSPFPDATLTRMVMTLT